MDGNIEHDHGETGSDSVDESDFVYEDDKDQYQSIIRLDSNLEEALHSPPHEQKVIAFDGDDSNDQMEDADLQQKLVQAGFEPGQFGTDAERALLKGETFGNWIEFDKAIHDYEATSLTVLTRVRRTRNAFSAKCRGWKRDDEDSCKVHITARLMKKTGLLTIRKVYLTHTCPSQVHKFRNGSNRVKWLSRKLKRHVEVNAAATVKQLNDTLVQFNGTSAQRHSVRRALTLCKEELAGGNKISFQKIPAYCEALQKVDPNVIVSWESNSDKRFSHLFVAPSSCQQVFKFCRPLVGLDGTHTTGDYPMILLFATCYDGENQIVILAWAVVPTENGSNWSWFMTLLRKAYPSLARPDCVIISDHDKGLKKGVEDVFPEVHHSSCVQHIKGNIKKIADEHCAKVFNKVVHACSKEEYDEILTSFTPVTEKQAAFVPYVRNIPPHLYARHAFPVPRWGHTTSNVVEVINSAVNECRSFPALQLSHFLWNYSMEKHYERNERAKKLPDAQEALTRFANQLLNMRGRESRAMHERVSSPTEGLVSESRGDYVVKIHERLCECLDWKEMDMPCAHAICHLTGQNLEARNFVGKIWSATNQKCTYQFPIPPISIDNLTLCGHDCLEPIFDSKTKAMGSRKKRIRSRSEVVTGRSQVHRCSICAHQGHNKKQCPVRPAICENENASSSHMNVVVADEHSMLRPDEVDLSICDTCPSTMNYSTWFAEVHASQTGPSQITQD